MTKVINPTDGDLTIVYKGTSYTVPANGSVNGVSESAAVYWRDMLHNFIILADDNSAADVVKEVVSKAEELKQDSEDSEETVKKVKGKK